MIPSLHAMSLTYKSVQTTEPRPRDVKWYLRDRKRLSDLLVATEGRVRLEKKPVLLRPLGITRELEHKRLHV